MDYTNSQQSYKKFNEKFNKIKIKYENRYMRSTKYKKQNLTLTIFYFIK